MGHLQEGTLIGSKKYVADNENTVRPGTPEEEVDDEKFMKIIESMNLTLYLLGDDRTVRVTSPRQLPEYTPYTYNPDDKTTVIFNENYPNRIAEKPNPEEFSIRLLEESISRLNRWIHYHTIQGSRRGETNVNEIFSDIIEQAAKDSLLGRRKKATQRESLIEKIKEIEQRNKEYSIFGLTSPFSGDKLVSSIKNVSTNKFKSIRPIIGPYLESLEVKMNALNSVKKTVEGLVEKINSFMIDKYISFHMVRGFRIRSVNKEELKPEMLSSGERHLLLLFCNAITAVDRQSIFIIDEPEISLNIKWQRGLVNSLLDIAKENKVQFIFATHSMEILSQHLDKVVKLESYGQRKGDNGN